MVVAGVRIESGGGMWGGVDNRVVGGWGYQGQNREW